MREYFPATTLATIAVPSAQQAPSEPIEALQQVARRVVATRNKSTRFPANRPDKPNPYGGKLAAAAYGAKGRAGVRSDLLSGTITLREIGLMSDKQIMARYRVKQAAASQLRSYFMKYGLGGAYRDAGGQPKPRPRA